jgi:phosphotransferase system enzyme I (PtsP)
MRPASIGPVKSLIRRSDLSGVRKVIVDARHRGEMSVRPSVMEWLRGQG